MRNLKIAGMLALLSLPEGEEETFINKMAENGTPIESLTVRKLKEEIAGYKATIEQKDKTYQQSLFDLGEQNKATVKQIKDKYQRELDDLNEQLAAAEQELKDRPTVTPEDYQPTKDALVDAKVALKLAEDAAQKQATEFKKQSDEAADKLQKAVEKIAKLKEEKKRSEDIQKQLYEIKQRGIEIPTEVFDVIVIDPPWDWGDEGDVNQFGRAKPEYSTMPFDDIKALPINEIADVQIEVGKRLIQAKSLVAHGEWLNWLEKNFQLKQRTAYNFIACAEKFGNLQSIASLNSTQMIALLALPDAEETEKFIAEKAAEGTPPA